MPEGNVSSVLPPSTVLVHVVDVHCHPTDSPISQAAMEELPIRICAMSTRPSDQPLVLDLAGRYPEKVIPCFGYHPWFSHWISIDPPLSKDEHYRKLLLDAGRAQHLHEFERLLPMLPDPIPLSAVLVSLRENVASFPNAMVGEVGLDRSARIPYFPPASPPYTLNEPSKRELSPFTIPLEHQIMLLEAQLEVAVEMGRNVSIHSVKSQQSTVEVMGKMKAKHGERWTAISVDLHSCGLSAETWKDIERKHPNAYMSLSKVINSRSPAHISLIAACSPTRILVESDYNNIDSCTPQTWAMIQTVAQVKGWDIEEAWEVEDQDRERWGVVRRLKENWEAFERGGHSPVGAKLNKGQQL